MKKSEKKRLREELEKFDSEEIRKKIERSREIPEIGRGIIKKRKETNTNEELEEMVSEILFHSIIIIMLGFFYFGAVPQYFGVNDEFINPSNSSIGYGNIGNMTNDAFIRVSSTLHESGASHPIFYFWFWWLLVFYIMIFPVIRFIWFIIKKESFKVKGGKHGISRRS